MTQLCGRFHIWKEVHWLSAWLSKRVRSRYLAISEAVKRSGKEDLGLPLDRIDVVHRSLIPEEYNRSMALDEDIARVRSELGLEQAHPVLINVARLVPQKGQDDLLRTMPKILERYPKGKLLIVGQGPLRGRLESLHRELGLGDHVTLLGKRSDVKTLLHASDAFVFSSHYEGFGNAVVEAMAAGLPVFAFRLGCLEEIIAQGESGWLIAGRDRDGMARAVVDAVGSGDLLKKLGARGQAIVKEKFDVRRNAIKYGQVIAGAVESAAAAA